MNLDEAVRLVLFAFEHGNSGDILVQKTPACTIRTLAEAVCEIFGADKKEIRTIGIRHGEKKHETLLSNEEYSVAVDMGNYYRIPADNRSLNYDKYYIDGDIKRNRFAEYSSNNTRMLTVAEVKEKLKETDYVREKLKNW